MSCHQGPGFIPSWQSPWEDRQPGCGGLCNPAVIAASAHPEMSGQFLSLTPSCLRFVGKGQFDGSPFTALSSSWMKWRAGQFLGASDLGLTSPLPAAASVPW